MLKVVMRLVLSLGRKGAIAYSRIAPNGYTCGGIRRSTAYSALRMSVCE